MFADEMGLAFFCCRESPSAVRFETLRRGAPLGAMLGTLTILTRYLW